MNTIHMYNICVSCLLSSTHVDFMFWVKIMYTCALVCMFVCSSVTAVIYYAAFPLCVIRRKRTWRVCYMSPRSTWMTVDPLSVTYAGSSRKRRCTGPSKSTTDLEGQVSLLLI